MTESAKSFLRDLRGQIESHPAVNHLFLNRLATSPFAKQDYRVFAENHYALVCVFTSYLESLLVRAPDSEAKLWLAKVLVDEYGEGSEGRDHSNLYASFLEATGGDPAQITEERVRTPAHQFITTHRRMVRQRPFLEGLGAVGPGHEWAIPKMFQSLIPGLRRAGFTETEIQYFTLHVEQDDDHGTWLEEALERYAGSLEAQQQIRRGAIESLNARGRFWDGVQREVIRYRQPRAPRPDGPRQRPLMGEVLLTAWDGFGAGKRLEDRVRGWLTERRPTLGGLKEQTRQL